MPIEDYGLYRHRMLDPSAMGWKYSASWISERAAELAAVFSHIRANGPTRASDFGRSDGESGAWWGWKSEKRSLEALFTSGALMIARRHNFQRVYDLAERAHPEWNDSRLALLADTRRERVLRAVKALGVCKTA